MVFRTCILVVVLSACALLPTSALAHEGNPNYRSVIDAVEPRIPGVELQILNYDDSFELTNRSQQTIVMQGYDGEDYLRFEPDGTVEVNRNSAALYINDERDGSGTVPPNAKRSAAPDWKVIDKTGRYVWHDHRIHYMGTGRPPAIKDPTVKAKAYDWKVPFKVGDRAAVVRGSLFWVPEDRAGGASVGAFVGLGVLALVGAGAAIVVRRRRRGQDPGGPAAAAATEAW